MDAEHGHTCVTCGGHKAVVMEGSPGGLDLSSLLQRAIEQVYRGKPDKVLKQLGEAYATALSGGAMEGLRQADAPTAAWEQPDDDFIAKLQENVWQFSHAKSYQQIKALSQAMVADGKVVPFKEFKEIAGRINNEFATPYLKLEYDSAIAGGQMAARWKQFKEEEEEFPNITYQTAGDGNVRPSHQALDNVTLPLSDSFWQAHYPPNGWGCRCDVIQSTGRKITDRAKVVPPDDTPKMFQVNLGQRGLIFPEGSSYYQHVPGELLKAAGDKNPFRYTKVKTEGKGYYYENALDNSDPHEVEGAKRLAKLGHKVVSLPEIPPNTDAQKELHKLCQPKDVREGRNVDWTVDGVLTEFKKTTLTNLEGHLRYAGKQGSNLRVIVELDAPATKEAFVKAARGRVKRTSIQEVWILNPDETIIKLNRDDF